MKLTENQEELVGSSLFTFGVTTIFFFASSLWWQDNITTETLAKIIISYTSAGLLALWITYYVVKHE